MTALGRGKDTVVVTPMIRARRNIAGVPEYQPGPPVAVQRVVVQPVEATENPAALMQQTRSTFRIIGRGAWPGGSKSTVRWNGRDYDQTGEARGYTARRLTAHFDVIITLRAVPTEQVR